MNNKSTMEDQTVRYLTRDEIDATRWDACVARAINGKIYAYSAFLDTMARNWDGLVVGDYELVMPVVWNQKFGFRYAYMPPFAQQFGIYGAADPGRTLTEFMFNKAYAGFSYVDTSLNFKVRHKDARSRERTNFVLQLNQSYPELRKEYSVECKINIRKAIKRGCSFVEDYDSAAIVDLFRTTYGPLNKGISATDYANMKQLAVKLKDAGQLQTYAVTDKANDELVFGALIAKSNGRLFYLLAAPNERGRKMRAAYYFIDEIIQRNAGSDIAFDFEGSDIPGVAAFYMRFGPDNERYYQVTANRLPWPFKQLKELSARR